MAVVFWWVLLPLLGSPTLETEFLCAAAAASRAPRRSALVCLSAEAVCLSVRVSSGLESAEDLDWKMEGLVSVLIMFASLMSATEGRENTARFFSLAILGVEGQCWGQRSSKQDVGGLSRWQKLGNLFVHIAGSSKTVEDSLWR